MLFGGLAITVVILKPERRSKMSKILSKVLSYIFAAMGGMLLGKCLATLLV